MMYQVQSLDNQSEAWDTVATENGDECFNDKCSAVTLEEKTNKRYPMTQTKIVQDDNPDWI
jgi:hypothetical protein